MSSNTKIVSPSQYNFFQLLDFILWFVFCTNICVFKAQFYQLFFINESGNPNPTFPPSSFNRSSISSFLFFSSSSCSGRYGKLHKFPVSQILNSNLCLIQFYLDNDWILILEKINFKSIPTSYVIQNLIFNQFKIS